MIKQLLDAGVNLQQARRAIACLRESGEDLATANLVLAGGGSVLARTGEEIVDLLRGGQGVFNIVPLAGVVDEIDAAIHGIDVTALARPQPCPSTPRLRARRAASPRGARRSSAAAAPRTPGPVRFAHESERQLAELLDFYGIAWEYEPVEFVLGWDERGPPELGVPAGLLPAGPRPVPGADDAPPGPRHPEEPQAPPPHGALP